MAKNKTDTVRAASNGGTPVRDGNETQASAAYTSAVAPEAVEVQEDRLIFPGGVLLPLSVRGGGVPGMTDRPWANLQAEIFTNLNTPNIYSVALRRESPDTLRSTMRARRTLFEGVLMAMAEKTGRRPSMAERFADEAMDAAESNLGTVKK